MFGVNVKSTVEYLKELFCNIVLKVDESARNRQGLKNLDFE